MKNFQPFAFVLLLLLLFQFHTTQAQVTADLFGSVTDKVGQPIFGASVYLEGTEKGAQTDFDGKYKITGISPGTYNLVVSYIGYETQTQYNVIIRSKGTPNYNFVLQESAQQLDEVVVSNANKISRPRETPLSTQSLSAVEIATYPGSNNDVVQVAQTLPGVSPSIGGFRNDLIIRGGAPNETVYYLDGMEIPNVNHFATQGSAGGPVGLINVSFIDNVTLSTSAFGSQYDNPLSGVLQFSQRNGNNRNFNGNFRVSASEAALTLEGPLFKKNAEESKTTFLASVRRSYLQFLFEAIGLPFRPNYWDYQYKINHKIDSYNDISLIGVGSIDDFSVEAPEDFDAEQQAQLEQAPFIEQRTNAIGVTWKNRFKDGSGFMETTLSNNTLVNDFTRFEDPENETGIIFRNDATESETKLRYAITKFMGDWKLTSGFNFQYSDYENETVNLTDGIAFNTAIDFYKYGLFANVTRSFFNDKLDVSFGFRLDDDTFTEEDNLLSTFSPRLSLSYEFSENWRVNGSVGRYFKIPPYTILGFRDNDQNLVNQNAEYTLSDHFVLGLQHYFGPSSSISLEGFYKRYDDYPVSVLDQVSLANKGADFEVLGSEDVETVGRGRSYGAELQFQQKLSNNFYGIFAYTWFYSEFTGFDRDVFLPSVWDSRHLISFTGGYKFKRNWELSARYRFAGETPFVPTDLEATLANYPEVILDYNRLGEENLNVFSQLDLRIDKKWNFEKLSLDVFVEAQNVLGQNIPQPPEFGLNRGLDGSIVEPRSLVEIESDTGQIIPSIGIVLDF
ncbi:TonB-dependent receptor [Flagellimonas meridianipacifica]|uniref:TonB-dependent receptor-like protein n=1 Tax=Flagellimonas meridianipacifica TaxID=1080225 RepID=A0A2T0MIA6_9FLAO|nr:TonB-dependent receptor [Allomuricauda pacifica]PRX57293.1 TonB-dependent receptor-like protein [Allomuricauda pacifica]